MYIPTTGKEDDEVEGGISKQEREDRKGTENGNKMLGKQCS